MSTLQIITELAAAAGFTLCGAFHPQVDDDVPDCGFSNGVGTLVLLGNVGGDMWSAFSAGRQNEPDAMDKWTRRTIDDLLPTLEDRVGPVKALYPFGGPPHHPFQRWAMRAEAVFPSPIGPLIHPEYGLWHAYRGALVLEERLSVPVRAEEPSPCDTCTTKPCLSTCPVAAFTVGSYDFLACANHLTTMEGERCLSDNCQARRACPVGQKYAYAEEQSRFHMSIFRDKYAT